MSVDRLSTMGGYRTSSTSYKDSFFREWLNQEFLKRLYNSNRFVATSPFCYGNETDECSVSVSDKVGLMTYSDYNNATNFNYDTWNLETSLNFQDQYVTTLTPISYNSSNYWVVDYWNQDKFSAYSKLTFASVNPVININATVGVVDGTDGSANNPYVLLSDNSATSGALLSSRTSGEYVKFANKTWRIVSTDEKDSSGVRITKLAAVNFEGQMPFDEYDNDTSTDGSAIFNIERKNNIGYRLNNTYYESLKTIFPSLGAYVTEGPWYRGVYDTRSSYKTTLNTTTREPAMAKVGIPRIGEIFATPNSVNNCDVMTLTPATDILNFYYIDYSGSGGSVWYDNWYCYRPEIYIKGDVKITSGTGRSENNPYILETYSNLELKGDQEIWVLKGSTYNDPGVIAYDKNGSNITTSVTNNGNTIDTNKLGKYTVTYTVTDSVGVTFTKTRTVYVFVYQEVAFAYSGGVREYVTPTTGLYKIAAWGARGGGSQDDSTLGMSEGGRGAYAYGEVVLKKGTKLYLYVGGKGSIATDGYAMGGYNGGGNAYGYSYEEDEETKIISGAGGGGASDVRLIDGSADNYESLLSRILVAGGGGGAGIYSYSTYGYGGDYQSYMTNGYDEYNAYQDSPGYYASLGIGASTYYGSGGAGAGGYFGGGTYQGWSYGEDTQGGGGGNSFISGNSSCNALDQWGNSTYQPNHFSGYRFTNSAMINASSSMLLPDDSTGNGNNGDGSIKIYQPVWYLGFPVITLNGNDVINLNVGDTYTELKATAKDLDNNDLTNKITISGTVNTSVIGSYVITYSVTDDHGNTMTKDRLVNVRPSGNVPPVITIIDEIDMVHNVNTPYADLGAIAVDSTNVKLKVTAVTNINPSVLGNYTVIYTAIDSKGNTTTATRIVRVVDIEKPVINFTQMNVTIQAGTVFDPKSSMSLSDNYSNSTYLTNELVITGTVNTAVLGTYTLTYVTHDSSGNYSDVITRKITVIDTTPPVLTLETSIVYMPIGTVYDYQSIATSIDNLDGNITAGIVISGSYNKDVLGNYTITYTSKDSNNNTSTKSLTIKVIDTSTSYTFDYTGTTQSIYIPATGNYKLEVWGAKGGNYSSGTGGNGGYSTGTLNLTKNTVLYVQVGGASTGLVGGYNGGGSTQRWGGGGGGATDIRLLSGNWDSPLGLLSRIIVAGGGGGAGYSATNGGAGGGVSGLQATGAGSNQGGGGTQSAGGSSYCTVGVYAIGGTTPTINGCNTAGGGGGGGWYGGGSGRGQGNDSGGGGGSGYILTSTSNKPGGYTPTSGYYMTNDAMLAGNVSIPNPTGSGTVMGNARNGYVKITYIP